MGSKYVLPKTLGWCNLRFAAISVSVGIIVAIGAMLFISKEWEAVAEIEIGEFGPAIAKATDSSNVSVPIEAPAVTIERIGSPAFVRAIVERAGIDPKQINEYLPKRFGGRGKLDVRQTFNTNLLIVRVRANNPNSALMLAKDCASEVIDAHLKIAEPEIYRNNASGSSRPETKSSSGSVLEIRNNVYLALASGAYVKNTRLLVPVALIEDPVYPSLLYCAMLGLLAVVVSYLVLSIFRFVLDGDSPARGVASGRQ